MSGHRRAPLGQPALEGLEAALDRLFAGDPARFTEARDALARDLRSGGDRAAAEAVRALRRPTRLAAELNRLAREDPGGVEELAAAAAALAASHEAVARGSGDAGVLRGAEDDERRALERLVARADRRLAADARAALRAAARSPAEREALRRGWLSRPPEPGGGGPGWERGAGRGAAAPARPGEAPGGGGEAAAAAAERLRAALEALDAARAGLERAAQDHAQARRAHREAAEAQERAEAARGAARAALEEAEAALRDAEARAAAAERSERAARGRRDDAQRALEEAAGRARGLLPEDG